MQASSWLNFVRQYQLKSNCQLQSSWLHRGGARLQPTWAHQCTQVQALLRGQDLPVVRARLSWILHSQGDWHHVHRCGVHPVCVQGWFGMCFFCSFEVHSGVATISTSLPYTHARGWCANLIQHMFVALHKLRWPATWVLCTRCILSTATHLGLKWGCTHLTKLDLPFGEEHFAFWFPCAHNFLYFRGSIQQSKHILSCYTVVTLLL